ncbi:hypothetical protein BDP27DRAFT_1427634 [Rhodocollybia butyracea]|uniref:Mug135-like C-terminal domain-containing protein n=1 Tax=Rhodocollybia butyracea TaxID=206335 RepID=A0A9P5PBV9_9AGAR|nr:hypothetical protein BDP27DRAFT_1427634 [Rhodocollybia butyracea]
MQARLAHPLAPAQINIPVNIPAEPQKPPTAADVVDAQKYVKRVEQAMKEGQATVETLGSAIQYLHQVASTSVEVEEVNNGNDAVAPAWFVNGFKAAFKEAVKTNEFKEAVSEVVKDVVKPIETRLDKMEARLEKIESRLDKIEGTLARTANATKGRGSTGNPYLQVPNKKGEEPPEALPALETVDAILALSVTDLREYCKFYDIELSRANASTDEKRMKADQPRPVRFFLCQIHWRLHAGGNHIPVTDADIIVRSADNFTHRLHRKNLELAADAFPLDKEDLGHSELPESSATLDILFEFIYPQQYVTLDDLDFGPLLPPAEAAEAAEKYQIRSAAYGCQVQFRKFLHSNTKELMAFGAKHGYHSLVTQLAPILVDTSLMDLVEILPSSVFIAWVAPQKAPSLIELYSSEGHMFALQPKYLEPFAEGFPPVGTPTDGEKIYLSEPTATLQLLFQFISSERYPSLENLDFEAMEVLTEAAEKYVVYPAIYACQFRLREFVATRPRDLLALAGKYSYTWIIVKLAPVLIDIPLSELVELIPVHYYVPWSVYREKWLDALPVVTEKLMKHKCERFDRAVATF